MSCAYIYIYVHISTYTDKYRPTDLCTDIYIHTQCTNRLFCVCKNVAFMLLLTLFFLCVVVLLCDYFYSECCGVLVCLRIAFCVVSKFICFVFCLFFRLRRCCTHDLADFCFYRKKERLMFYWMYGFPIISFTC